MATSTSQDGAQDLPPARMLYVFVYCPRLFCYGHVEGIFLHNADAKKGASDHHRVGGGKGNLPKANKRTAAPGISRPTVPEIATMRTNPPRHKTMTALFRCANSRRFTRAPESQLALPRLTEGGFSLDDTPGAELAGSFATDNATWERLPDLSMPALPPASVRGQRSDYLWGHAREMRVSPLWLRFSRVLFSPGSGCSDCSPDSAHARTWRSWPCPN
jgi:hypothetical protein